MRRRAAALAVAIAAATASCASVLGIDDQAKSAAEELCLCNMDLAFLGTPEACKLRVDDRLRSAADADRAAWLDAYVSGCEGATCAEKVHACFYLKPLCTETGFGCTANEECCSFPTGGDCHDSVCR